MIGRTRLDRPCSGTMVIDAVDECRSKARAASYTFLKMLEDLSDIMQESLRPVKLFISSQNPHDGIESFYKTLNQ
jgi:hypothetical protein